MTDCKGCYTYMLSFIACSPLLVGKTDKCPCRICLVKGVCRKACVEYKDYSFKHVKIIQGEDK